MDKLTIDEQLETLRYVLGSGLTQDWRIAIDGGANDCEWSRLMAEHFETVHAFEPGADVIPEDLPNNVIVRTSALMDAEGFADLITPPKRPDPRSRFVQRSDNGITPCTTIDGLCLEGCGLIKLDLEGAEYFALKGAEETIKRYHPILIVEIDLREKQLGLRRGMTESLIHEMGYREVWASGPDKVFA